MCGGGEGGLLAMILALNIAFVIPFNNTWLLLQGYDKANKRLAIATCANQDPLQPTTGRK